MEGDTGLYDGENELTGTRYLSAHILKLEKT